MSSRTISFQDYLTSTIPAVSFVERELQSPTARKSLEAVVQTIKDFTSWESEPRLKILHDVSVLSLQQLPEKPHIELIPASTSSFTTLPFEIQELIALSLPLNSLLRLSETCRDLFERCLYWISRDETKLGRYLSHLLQQKNEERIDALLQASGPFPLNTRCNLYFSLGWPRIAIVLDKIQRKFPDLELDLEPGENPVEEVPSNPNDVLQMFLGTAAPFAASQRKASWLDVTHTQIVLSACPHLKRLFICSSRLQSSSLSTIAKLHHLSELQLCHTKISDREFTTITHSCPNLRKLFLRTCKGFTAEAISSYHPRHLEVLNINDSVYDTATLKNILTQDSSNGVILTLLACRDDIALSDRKKYVQQALGLMPSYARAHECFAMISWLHPAEDELPDYTLVKKHLIRSYKIYPFVSVIYNLALFFQTGPDALSKDLGIATFLYNDILKNSPQHVRAMTNLAEIHILGDDKGAKNPKRANELLHNALELDPTHLPAIYLQCTLLINGAPEAEIAQDRTKAQELLRRAETYYPLDKRTISLREKFNATASWIEKSQRLVKQGLHKLGL